MASTSEKNGLQALFLDGLKDILYAEKKILKSLPKMAKSAEDRVISQASEKHRAQTVIQVERLEEVFAMLAQTPRGKPCPAIDGILEEGDEIMREFKGSPAIDAGLVAAAQAVEHYEIARYRTLCAWAQQLGLPKAAKLLTATLAEESETDATLVQLAESGANDRAIQKAA